MVYSTDRQFINTGDVQVIGEMKQRGAIKYVGSPYRRAKIYAARMPCGGSSHRSIFAARARAQQQTRRPPLLLSIDGTDGQTDGHSTVTRRLPRTITHKQALAELSLHSSYTIGLFQLRLNKTWARFTEYLMIYRKIILSKS